METALTFGSLGDIIARRQLTIQLRRALGRGRGAIGSSSEEYQELRRNLDLFVQILLQVNPPGLGAVLPLLSPLSACSTSSRLISNEKAQSTLASSINEALQRFQNK